MEYATRSFHCYDNKDMDAWMNKLAADGFKLVNFKAVGSSTVLIIMEKV